MDGVTYLVLAGENNHHGGISSDEQEDFTGRHSAANTIGRNNRPNITQQNELTCRSFHFSTDKPSTRDTIHPKKIRKVTIQHQRRRGKNRQTLAKLNQKTEKAKRKYQPLSSLFRSYKSFSISGSRTQKSAISTDLWHNQTLLQFIFKLAPNFRFSPSSLLLGTLRLFPSSPSQIVESGCGCEIEKNQTREIQVGEGRNKRLSQNVPYSGL